MRVDRWTNNYDSKLQKSRTVVVDMKRKTNYRFLFYLNNYIYFTTGRAEVEATLPAHWREAAHED